jgi:hypothetical protein
MNQTTIKLTTTIRWRYQLVSNMIDCEEWLLSRWGIPLVVHQKLNDAFSHLIYLHFVLLPAPHVPLCCQFDAIEHTDSYNKQEKYGLEAHSLM